MNLVVQRLGSGDTLAMRRLNSLFSTVFDDPASYASAPPADAYVQRLLGRDEIIALVAREGEAVVGGLVAYLLEKLEQERSEIYIYDLAVAEEHRRRGVATALIGHLQQMAADLGAWVIYVQADHGDDPAIALYDRLGRREQVLHFDIPPAATR